MAGVVLMVEHDVVIRGGRVFDPESRNDEAADVGLAEGMVKEIGPGLSGRDVIDATGLLVVPGFIDLHVHINDEATYRAQARGGVTTSLELELGTDDVAGWYERRADGQPVNYGVAVGHIPARMAVMGDSGVMLPTGSASLLEARHDQVEAMGSILRRGLDEGAVAVGFGLEYTPAATEFELDRMLTVAAAGSATCHIHLRRGREGLDEVIAAARRTGAAVHVVHLNSSALEATPEFLDTIGRARGDGIAITAEGYPYVAAMTRIESALFDDWEEWADDRLSDVIWVDSGERLDRDSFASRRAEGGGVLFFPNTEEMVEACISSPVTMVASDAFLVEGKGHPRTAGTFTRVLGRYVRERKILPLHEAIVKMTLQPARLLESRVPAMRRKGRLKVGGDADLTIFDPETVADNASLDDPAAPPDGVPHVLVGGVPVVLQGRPTGARPGRAIRAPIAP